jgi:serine protease Do
MTWCAGAKGAGDYRTFEHDKKDMKRIRSLHFSGLAVLAVFALATAAVVPGSLAASSEKAELDRAVARVFPALVRITVVMEEPGEGRLEKHTGAGSGAIISEDGYIITNHHVAGKARHLLVRLADGEEIEARLIGTDALADIAVIQLDLSRRKKKGKLPVARFGDSDKVTVGDTVLAMGSPMAVSQSVTKGIVSNLQLMMPSLFWFAELKLDGESVGSLVRWIGHDAAIYGGNSGGPLVNLDGEIIGINEVSLASLAGAIPVNLARSVADQLIQKGCVERSWTGVEPQPLLRGGRVECGVLVAGVIESSPAAEAGLRAGDIITEFDGVAVNGRLQEDLPTFNALVMSTPIGKQVKVKSLREGREQTFTFATVARGVARDNDLEFKQWGLTACNFTRLSAIERKRPSTEGLLVTTVNPAGPAGSAKPALQADDCLLSIAGKPVRSVADLRAITTELTRNTNRTELVVVEFERGVARMLTAVRPKPTEPRPEENPRKPGLAMLLQPIGPELAEAMKLRQEGARVAFVFPGSTAEKAGLRAGDILVSFDGEAVRCRQESDLGHFLAEVRHRQIGDEVECGLLRDRQPLKLRLKLSADDPEEESLKSFKDKELEFSVRDLTKRERVVQRIPADVKGPRVTEVKSSGWASLGHVAVNDLLLSIDGTPTPDVAAAERLLRAAAEKKARRIVLLLRRGVHTLFAELEPTWDSPAASR